MFGHVVGVLQQQGLKCVGGEVCPWKCAVEEGGLGWWGGGGGGGGGGGRCLFGFGLGVGLKDGIDDFSNLCTFFGGTGIFFDPDLISYEISGRGEIAP